MLKGATNFFMDGSVGGAPQMVGGTAPPQVSAAIDAQARSGPGPQNVGVASLPN